jgi:protein involved in polysaccharide export with SLBB domain
VVDFRFIRYLCLSIIIAVNISLSQSSNVNAIKKELSKFGLTIDDAIEIAKDENLIDDSSINSGVDIDSPNSAVELNPNEIIKEVFSTKNQLSSHGIKTNIEDNSKLLNQNLDDKNTVFSIGVDILDSKKSEDHYFGYNNFYNDPSIFEKTDNDAIDPNYLIGPGDEIIIMLWGDTEFLKKLNVSIEGYLFIKNIGQVYVNGLDLSQLELKLYKLLSKVYSSLNPTSGEATTFIDVSLGSLVLRPVRIFVLGEVKQPGAYSVKSSTSFYNSLYYFNGPSIKGSLRELKLLRKEKEIATIDYYDYLLKGKTLNDIRLMRDDIIFIPPRKKTVTVQGEISRPSIYELKEKENLNDLIDIAGGLVPTTYTKRLQIKRILPYNQRTNKNSDRIIIDVELNKVLKEKNNYLELVDGDEVTFFKIFDTIENSVSIKGEVNRPGVFDLGSKRLSLVQLIEKSDGLTKDAYTNRVEIIRRGIIKDSLIVVNLTDILLQKGKNIFLNPNDEVTIKSKKKLEYQGNVSIDGFVLDPGEKIFFEGMTLSDLIFRAGGFQNIDHLSRTYLKKAELSRFNFDDFKYDNIDFKLDSVLAGNGLANLELNIGDRVKIFSKKEILGVLPNTVKISGYVKNPGDYTFYEGMKLSELLFKAAGIKDETFYNNLFLERLDIYRLNEFSNERKILTFSLLEIIDSTNNFDPLLKDGDEVRIFSKLMYDPKPSVKINGFVKNPGKYEMFDNMTIVDLLLASGGVIENMHNFRVDLTRFIDSNDNINQISENYIFDFKNIKDSYFYKTGNRTAFKLQNHDFIIVRNDRRNYKNSTVSILGEVVFPGKYSINYKDETIYDLIIRAGGLTENAYLNSSKFIRNGEEIYLSFDKLMKNSRSKDNFSVINSDSITIGTNPRLVKIIGEVNSPGNYIYKDGWRIRNYINAAGGLTKLADKKTIFVQYPNGSSKHNNFYISPLVNDGSIISVGKVPETKPFSFTEYATSLTAIWADLTQAILLLRLVSNGGT